MTRKDYLKLASMFPMVCSGVLHLAAGCTGASTDEPVGAAESALTAAQCQYFDVDGKVQVCHKTNSINHPYTILKISEQACMDGHASHAGDYVAVGDPTCQGDGCLPQGAPCDATLPCCSGSACVSGTCVANCVPTTCADEGAVCGTISDGCGDTLDCSGACSEGGGTCAPDDTCGCPAPDGYDPGCATNAWDEAAQECELSFAASGTACASGDECDGAGHCVAFTTVDVGGVPTDGCWNCY
ncbi:hypothetical protein WMF26_33135 [Sorangium sp. So ce185]|uniref:hypothetical protein n=1 Tax=Sorangium sp. So ce185 TaxID=3133287 RepID=UPI003F644B0B